MKAHDSGRSWGTRRVIIACSTGIIAEIGDLVPRAEIDDITGFLNPHFCRFVGDIATFLILRYFCFPKDIGNCLRLSLYSRYVSNLCSC